MATPLWILLGTVAIVFLIACTNVANLFLVRAESRRRDLAVRRALGAGRAGLVRTQMAEAFLLAAAGGVSGTLIAWAGVPSLIRAAPDAVAGGFTSAPIPRLSTAGLDITALVFTAGISVLAALAFGLLPAIRFTGAGLLGSLRQAGRGVVGRGGLTRDVLVVVQTAAALVLLVGSALLARSFWQLSHVDSEYDTDDIFTFQVAVHRDDLGDRASMSRFQYEFMDRLAAVPGVVSVGFLTTLPLEEGAGSTRVTSEQIESSGAEPPVVRNAGAGGAYFQRMGIDLLRGQFFERVEEEQGIPNVIISQAAADLPFPGEDPLDRRIRPADNPDTWFTVIGVVEDVRVDDFRQPPQPMLYLPGVSASPAYVMKTARAERIALGVTRFLPSLLFGVQALDASTFMVMSGVMLGVALIASYGSARRASGVDVVEVLGVE